MIIHNKYLPVKRFVAMAFWPFILVREDRKVEFTKALENHERIHFAQQKELFLIGFYLLYLIYWVKGGYDNIPFEREAYLHQRDPNYLLNRKKYHWRTYGKVRPK